MLLGSISRAKNFGKGFFIGAGPKGSIRQWTLRISQRFLYRSVKDTMINHCMGCMRLKLNGSLRTDQMNQRRVIRTGNRGSAFHADQFKYCIRG